MNLYTLETKKNYKITKITKIRLNLLGFEVTNILVNSITFVISTSFLEP